MLLTGGKVWTKNMEDGNTVGVRIDPAKQRRNPLGHSDEVPHAHKEKVSQIKLEMVTIKQLIQYLMITELFLKKIT